MRRITRFLKRLGPGFITGASGDDPSGIATYSQSGAMFGYTQLWVALYSFPFMFVIQEMCGRIGMVTGSGLAGVMRKHYPKKILYFSIFLLLIANTVNIGANLGAMAASVQLLIPIPFTTLLLIITGTTLFLEVFVSYKTYTKYLKYLALSLLAYAITVFVVKQDWDKIALSTLIPHFSLSKEYLLNIVALLGTTISPYLFFWQANQEVEEEIAHHKLKQMGVGKPNMARNDVKYMRFDTATGMFFSNLTTFFIIATTASTLHSRGLFNIETAPQAAESLRPFAGDFAFLLFALGIIGTGLLSVPILAGSASYAIAEAFGWKEGLSQKFNKAHGFYGVITVATILGLVINYTNIQPFTLLYYTAVLNGLCAPVLMAVIILIGNNKKIMGKNTNSLLSNIGALIILGVMTLSGIALLISFVL